MTRLLLALLAILTGLAAAGTPVLATVEAQSAASASVTQETIGARRLVRPAADARIVPGRATYRGERRAIRPADAAPMVAAIRLKADRAHE